MPEKLDIKGPSNIPFNQDAEKVKEEILTGKNVPDAGKNDSDDETKSDKFRRLASQRVQAILDDIDRLGKLANPSTYEWSPEQLAKIFNEISAKMKECADAFAGQKKKSGFSL
jgi:hypothetical protein